jgi:hypothetical protein
LIPRVPGNVFLVADDRRHSAAAAIDRAEYSRRNACSGPGSSAITRVKRKQPLAQVALLRERRIELSKGLGSPQAIDYPALGGGLLTSPKGPSANAE